MGRPKNAESNHRYIANEEESLMVGLSRKMFDIGLDVMHIEKNVCDSLIGLLLNISGKTKDGVNARKDMVLMGIRLQLAPEEKGYSANIKKLVSMQDCKLIGVGAEKWYQTKHNQQFAYWLKDKVTANLGQPNVNKTVEKLGEGPKCVVRSYQGYDINGYTFYTQDQDEKSTMQNSGVTVVASKMEFDRLNHDARLTIAKGSYVWRDTRNHWVLGLPFFTIPLEGYASDPFILAKLATQVFFVKDPSSSRWHIVLQGKRCILGVDNVEDEDEYDQFDELPPFSIGIPSIDDDIANTTYLRPDHNEGLWVD
ncbi:ribonuclease H-like domain-containing protein [Tanacetum coccineum]